MTILHHKNILATAALVVFATFNFASTASAQQGRCDLTVKGSGRHSCQCETLVNHRADWRTLMRLSAMDVCDSPKSGNGSANPVIEIPEEKCYGKDKRKMYKWKNNDSERSRGKSRKSR